MFELTLFFILFCVFVFFTVCSGVIRFTVGKQLCPRSRCISRVDSTHIKLLNVISNRKTLSTVTCRRIRSPSIFKAALTNRSSQRLALTRSVGFSHYNLRQHTNYYFYYSQHRDLRYMSLKSYNFPYCARVDWKTAVGSSFRFVVFIFSRP